jgi:hypothetical protein
MAPIGDIRMRYKTFTTIVALLYACAAVASDQKSLTNAEVKAYIEKGVSHASSFAKSEAFGKVLIALKREGYVIDELFYGKDDRFNGMVMWLKGDYDIVLYAEFDGVNKKAADKVGRSIPYTTGWKTGGNRLGPAQTEILEAAQNEFRLTRIGVTVPRTYALQPARAAAVAFGALVIDQLESMIGKPTAKKFTWDANGANSVDGWKASWKDGIQFIDVVGIENAHQIWIPVK